MSHSMHEIAEKRQCKSCGFSDPEALAFNKEQDEKKNWAISKPWCRYPFKLEMSDDYLTCFKHPDYIESKALTQIDSEIERENKAWADSH